MAVKTATKTSKTKSETKAKNTKQRRTFIEWKDDIKEAEGVGFSHGYDSIEDLPSKLKCGRTAAGVGYKRGAKARQNARKAEAKARKYRK